MQSESVYPTITDKSRCPSTPDRDSTRGDSCDAALPLGPGLKFGVPQHPARVFGNFQRPNIEVDQTKTVVAQSFVVEIAVPGDERGSSQASQQRDDFVVLHSFAPDIITDVAEVNAPPVQLDALILDDVFIQYDHAGTGLSRKSSARGRRCSVPTCTCCSR